MKKEYTQRTARLIGQDKVDELDTKKVLIFGVGGVGSAVVEALGRAGVGHLILVDADVFDPSNVNRQLGATVQTIGRAESRSHEGTPLVHQSRHRRRDPCDVLSA